MIHDLAVKLNNLGFHRKPWSSKKVGFSSLAVGYCSRVKGLSTAGFICSGALGLYDDAKTGDQIRNLSLKRICKKNSGTSETALGTPSCLPPRAGTSVNHTILQLT